MRENQIVKSILDYLNSQPNCVAEKVHGSASSSGKADINACVNGRSVRIEVKTADHGNKESMKQSINLKRWEAAGAYCIITYTLKDVVTKLTAIGLLSIEQFEQSYLRKGVKNE